MKINQLERHFQQNAFGYRNRVRTLRKRDFGKSINKQNQALREVSTVAEGKCLLTELHKHPKFQRQLLWGAEHSQGVHSPSHLGATNTNPSSTPCSLG